MEMLDVKFKSTVQRAEMALAATLLPSGRVRSVMASTTLGLARAGCFTSSDTYTKTNPTCSGIFHIPQSKSVNTLNACELTKQSTAGKHSNEF